MTKHLLLTFLAIAGFSIGARAQFGLNAHYFSGDDRAWYLASANNPNTTPILDKGYAFGLNYWFRLKNYRVEFLPELSAGFAEASWDGASEADKMTFKHTLGSLFLNTQIYFLDIKGDCNCPTFSKEGPTFEKGLFVFITPGVTLWNTKASSAVATSDEQALAFSIGGGIGMDFGVSDVLTITPLLGLRYYPDANFPTLETFADNLPLGDEIVAESSLLQYYAGLRLGFRFDYNNRRRRW